jgi:hypothetical protein
MEPASNPGTQAPTQPAETILEIGPVASLDRQSRALAAHSGEREYCVLNGPDKNAFGVGLGVALPARIGEQRNYFALQCGNDGYPRHFWACGA